MSKSKKLSIPLGEESETLDEITDAFIAWKRTKIRYFTPTENDQIQLARFCLLVKKYCGNGHHFTMAQFYWYKDGIAFEHSPVKFQAKQLNVPWVYDNYKSYRNIVLQPKISSHYAELLFNQNNQLSYLLEEYECKYPRDTREQLLYKILKARDSDLFSWYRLLNSVYLSESEKTDIVDLCRKEATPTINLSMLSELEDKADVSILKQLLNELPA